MRRQLVLIISIGINGCLLILLLSTGSRPRQQASSALATPDGSQAPVSNSVRTHVVVRKQFFLWEELESPDYKAYVSNLTAIQCPPLTIRDIIVADVNQAYLFRRLTEIKDPLEEWWRSSPDAGAVAQNRRERSAMEAQRRSFLDSLLSTNWESASLPAQFNVCLTGPVLGAVSQEKKLRVLDVLQRAAQRRASYELAQGLSSPDALDAGYADLNRQVEAQMAAVLLPSEMEEYLLRYSDLSADLRNGFQDFAVTRDEFLRAFRLVFPLRQKMLTADGDSPDFDSETATMEKKISDGIRGILGLKRFSYYRMRTDEIYREAVTDAGVNAGSPRVVQAIYDSLRTLDAESKKVLADPSLSDIEKQEQLALLREQQLEDKDQILASDLTATNAPPPVPAPPDGQPYRTHAYSPGETIDQIAAEYGVRPADILKANPDVDFQGLQKATPIRIPAPKQ